MLLKTAIVYFILDEWIQYYDFVFINLQKSLVKSPSRFNRLGLSSFSSPSDFEVFKIESFLHFRV